MDFKMPRKAESAVRWAGLLLLTAVFFLELGEEINQTLLFSRAAPSKSLGSVHCREVNTYIYYKPQIKGKRCLGVSQDFIFFFK